MPRISEFFGIIVAMYYSDHSPPHFHARYGEYEAQFEIDSLEMRKGKLPRRAVNLVLEWALLHRSELKANWRRAQRGQPLRRIEPLE